MEKHITSIKRLKGTRFFKAKKIPRSIGKIRDVVFYPNKNCVAGFITKQSDVLLMFKRKRHFVSVKGYYMYEDIGFARAQKGTMDRSAYKALGLRPDDCVLWLDVPVLTQDGQQVGVVTDVTFVHQSGEVLSIEASLGTVGKILQSSRTIPVDLIKGYRDDVSTALSLPKVGDGEEVELPAYALVVAPEALEIAVENAVATKVSQAASDAGVDTVAVSEKAKSAAEVAGSLAKSGAVATGKQLKKTKGMFSAFKDEFDKAQK